MIRPSVFRSVIRPVLSPSTSASASAGSSSSSLPLSRFSSTSSTTPANVLITPAAQFLLHQHNVPDSEIPHIDPTGPGNRLLKADVLAYVGSVGKEYVLSQAAKIEKMGQLDLSGIKIRESAKAGGKKEPAKAGVAEKGKKIDAAAAAAVSSPRPVTVQVPISLACALNLQTRLSDLLDGQSVPLAELISRAVECANEDVLVQDAANAESRRRRMSAQDLLFDEIVGGSGTSATAGRETQSVFVPEILDPSTVRAPAQKGEELDLFDEIVGNHAPRTGTSVRAALAGVETSGAQVLGDGTLSGAVNVFSLDVQPREKARAEAFLLRVKELLEREPGSLVL